MGLYIIPGLPSFPIQHFGPRNWSHWARWIPWASPQRSAVRAASAAPAQCLRCSKSNKGSCLVHRNQNPRNSHLEVYEVSYYSDHNPYIYIHILYKYDIYIEIHILMMKTMNSVHQATLNYVFFNTPRPWRVQWSCCWNLPKRLIFTHRIAARYPLRLDWIFETSPRATWVLQDELCFF